MKPHVTNFPAGTQTRWFTGSALLFLAIGLAGGCGGPSEAHVSEAFTQIQRQEARIENGIQARAACSTLTECEPQREICQAADRICQIADDLDDTDAHWRCRDARRRCEVHDPEGEQ